MDGKTLKEYLRKQNITQEDAATRMGISRQTLTRWLGLAEFDNEQRDVAKNKLLLPENFFDHSITQVGEGNIAYGTLSNALSECEKDKAVLEERVAQLMMRLAEKDNTIKLLSKQLK